MSEKIRSRIQALRTRMKEAGAHICLITGDDYHLSEYSGGYFGTREFFSGFTGSAGILVVSLDEAWLFTDGRYFTQAEQELEGSGIILMKSGTQGVPDVKEHLRIIIQGENAPLVNIAFDARTVSASLGRDIEKINGAGIIADFDPVGDMWEDRPAFPSSEIFILDEKYAGESVESKVFRLREKIKESGADVHVEAALDDIAWILNLRGSDVQCDPVFMSYLLVEMEEVTLFVQENAVGSEVKKNLDENHISIRNYDEFYAVCKEKKQAGKIFLADKKRINYRIYQMIDSGETILRENPIVLFKAIKNKTEIENLIDIHKEDGACVTRLMMRVKELKDGECSETDAAEYVDGLRKKISDFYELSFPTISAYGANAAMMHYTATPECNALIKKEGMLLVDSGGQYLRGTTDVTRTFAVGAVTHEMKKAFTLTLKGLLSLSDAVFLKGCSGYSLDILARGALWKEGIDYRCGTGHGVGYMLNVHESPNAFRWRYLPGVSEIAQLEPGMVTTDEPGVYIPDKFGIRIENELLCEKAFENEYGTFLRFRTLTLAPIDLDLVDIKLLNEDDKRRLNEYHKTVREELMPYMQDDAERKFWKSIRNSYNKTV